VVDDEKSIRVSLRAILQDAGYEADVAEDALVAQGLLAQGAYDVVVSDIVLPGVSGVALLKRIRETAPDVQVIMMTGEPTAETAAEAVRAGARDYLTKPVDKNEILRAVASALQMKQIVDEKRRLEEENRRYRENLEDLVAERTAALRVAEAEMHQRQRQIYHMDRVQTLGEIASSLAHEVNQPLAGILSNAQAAQEFLARPHPDLEELREILTDIVADDKRASAIVHRMRAMLRKEETTFVPVDINGVVREAMAILHADLSLHGIAVRAELADNLVLVRADKVQIEQVILNLVRNAGQAMEGARSAECGVQIAEPSQRGTGSAEGGALVVVSTRRDASGQVIVSVQDSGPGIAAEAMSRLFDPFYTTKADGLGMGLAICRSIVTAHGGRIWAENHPDGGAVVSFTLNAEGGAGNVERGTEVCAG
jgi:signal transduction histidine kinase